MSWGFSGVFSAGFVGFELDLFQKNQTAAPIINKRINTFGVEPVSPPDETAGVADGVTAISGAGMR